MSQSRPDFGNVQQVVISSDHRGLALRDALAGWCSDQGLTVSVRGPADSSESVDYPDEALAIGEAVAAGQADLGLLICGTGIGISIAANKVRGIRAALVAEPHSAALARRHNDANVLCFGSGTIAPELAISTLDAFLKSSFEGGRHARRVEKIAAMERRAAADRAGEGGSEKA